MKAQAEIVIVLAALILVITLVTIVFQTGLNSPDITNLASVFRDEVSRRLYDGSFDVVKTISLQGGVLDPVPNSVDLAGTKVAYWQMCQNKALPSLADIRKNIKLGIERFVSNLNINDFQGKRASLSLKDLDIIIRNQDILATFTLNTNLAGYDLDPLYEIRIPANLAEVYNFASDFVDDNVQKRHFERFLLSLMFRTDQNTLPTSGILTKCGQAIIRTWDDVQEQIEKLRDYSFVNIVFWASGIEEFKYYIPTLNGKKYDNLKINFFGDDLTRSNLQSSRNPISIINSKTISIVAPYCIKDYEVEYSLNSPVVVKVTGTPDYSFNFAVLPFIENNKIGKCSGQQSFSYGSDICTEAKCDVKLSVLDVNDKPIPNTQVNFGACSVGKTDFLGEVKGKVPCGIAELVASNPKYTYFADVVSSKNIPEKIKLTKLPTINVNFYRGNTQVKITSKQGSQAKTDIIKIETGQIEGDYIFAKFKSKTASPWSQKEFILVNAGLNKSTVTSQIVDFLPSDNYTVEVSTMKKATYKYQVCDTGLGGTGIAKDCDSKSVPTVFNGKIIFDFELKESTKDLYITSMIPAERETRQEQTDFDYTPNIVEVSKCFDPISTTKPRGVCIV